MSKEVKIILKQEKVLVSTNFSQSTLSHSLTKEQWNLFFYGIYKLNESKNNMVKFNIKDFCSFVNIKPLNFYQYIKENIKLIDTLKITTDNIRFEKFKRVGIVNEINYENGILKMVFNNSLVKEFQQLTNNYSLQDLNTFISFESRYSKKLYMYFRSIYKPSEIRYRTMSEQELRDLLGVNDIYNFHRIDKMKLNIKNIIKDINMFCKEFLIDIDFSKKRNVETKKFQYTFHWKITPLTIKTNAEIENGKEFNKQVKQDIKENSFTTINALKEKGNK